MKNCLDGKTVVLCVCGGIAAYKSVEVLRQLQRIGARVRVIMTHGVQEFVGPLTFQALSGEPVFTALFDKGETNSMRHIDWANEADAVLVAPATANVIGKLANGIADDAMSTFMLAVKSPVILCPSMNTYMYESKPVQRNLDILEQDGYHIVEPGTGELACGVTGAGRFPDPEIVVDRLLGFLTTKDMKGKKILVTAGPTQEFIDPVRFISNPSSGKMGYAISKMAEYRGAEVTLVSGPVNISPPLDINFINVTSALEMEKAVMAHAGDMDIIIKSAAVSDYRVKDPSDHKMKKDKDEMEIALVKNPDILKRLGKNKKKGQILVGFAAETQSLVENAGKKVREKNLDMIVANIVGRPESGFGIDTNIVTLLYKDGSKEALPSMAKEDVANALLDRIIKLSTSDK